jgi:apolipoprotein D and lipocalin family protein
MRRTIRRVALASVLALSGAGVSACSNEPLDVASNVDLQQFQGKWYEVARLPRMTQTDCYATMGFYTAQSSGGLQFVHQCNVGSLDGPVDTVTMAASVPDRSTPAKLAVDIAGFTGDYWILDVDPNYQYALVGHPSRQYLWLLSRTPTLDTATTQTLVDKAQSLHFDTSQLVFTPQATDGERVSSPGPVGNVPSALNNGCAIGPVERRGEVLPWAVALLAAAGAAFRRRARA